MKSVISPLCLLFLVLLLGCETKSTKKEVGEGFCGTMDLPENQAYLNVPNVVSEYCFACHDINNKVVGTSFKEISKRNLSKKEFISLMEDPKEFNSKSEIPHPVFSNLSDNEISNIYNWIDSLKYN